MPSTRCARSRCSKGRRALASSRPAGLSGDGDVTVGAAEPGRVDQEEGGDEHDHDYRPPPGARCHGAGHVPQRQQFRRRPEIQVEGNGVRPEGSIRVGSEGESAQLGVGDADLARPDLARRDCPPEFARPIPPAQSAVVVGPRSLGAITVVLCGKHDWRGEVLIVLCPCRRGPSCVLAAGAPAAEGYPLFGGEAGRVDRVAVDVPGDRRGATVAAIIGTTIEKPLWVSSSTRMRAVSGACIEAPIMAAAPTNAKAPTGEPCHKRDQAARGTRRAWRRCSKWG